MSLANRSKGGASGGLAGAKFKNIQNRIQKHFATSPVSVVRKITERMLHYLFSYCAQYILHSGWYPDYVARLFRRGKARFTDDLVHERLLTQGPSAKLKSPLVHLIFPNFESVIDKVNRYSTVGAVSLSMKGRSAILLGAWVRGMRAVFRNYVLRR